MTAPERAGVVRRTVDWAFRNRQTGAITVAQWPNVPLAVFLVATVALLRLHVLKCDSGSTPEEPLGASAIHSALELEHEHDWVVETLSPERLASVTFSA